MSDPNLMKRVAEAQNKFKEPYNKMIKRIEEGDRLTWLNAIRSYYDNATGEVVWDQKTEEERKYIENANDSTVKSICIDLCREAINRDFVSWVTKGTEGPVGKRVYEALYRKTSN
jgi:hypothetical protein